jgi:GR25 family glycosyltransferase involved in LPS biosynthesis
MIPVIVISVPSSLARRAGLHARLDALGVPFTFHDAIDARDLDDAAALRLCPSRSTIWRRFPLSRGEIACAASHFAGIRSMVARGERFACILEDDVMPPKAFAEFLDSEWLASLPRFDILKLAGEGGKRQDLLALPIGQRNGHTLCIPFSPSWGGYAYIVSDMGARRILAASPIVGDTLDITLFRKPRMSARILELRPNVIAHDETGPSLLTPDRVRSRDTSWWWEAASWIPHRLALMGNKVRRWTAFCGFAGFAALFRLQRVEIYPDRTLEDRP